MEGAGLDWHSGANSSRVFRRFAAADGAPKMLGLTGTPVPNAFRLFKCVAVLALQRLHWNPILFDYTVSGLGHTDATLHWNLIAIILES